MKKLDDMLNPTWRKYNANDDKNVFFQSLIRDAFVLYTGIIIESDNLYSFAVKLKKTL